MPYTPPAGNAVNFNFYGTPYTPPLGHSIVFNFGVGGGGGPATPQLPTGMRAALLYEDDWYWQPQTRFAPPPVGVSGPLPAPPRMSPSLLASSLEEEPWRFRYQPVIYVPSPVTTNRPWLFCAT